LAGEIKLKLGGFQLGKTEYLPFPDKVPFVHKHLDHDALGAGAHLFHHARGPA
jgi:hypothetical protein